MFKKFLKKLSKKFFLNKKNKKNQKKFIKKIKTSKKSQKKISNKIPPENFFFLNSPPKKSFKKNLSKKSLLTYLWQCQKACLRERLE